VADAIVTIYYDLFKELEVVMAAKINPNPPLLA
jgi:hypothetical protein